MCSESAQFTKYQMRFKFQEKEWVLQTFLQTFKMASISFSVINCQLIRGFFYEPIRAPFFFQLHKNVHFSAITANIVNISLIKDLLVERNTEWKSFDIIYDLGFLKRKCKSLNFLVKLQTSFHLKLTVASVNNKDVKSHFLSIFIFICLYDILPKGCLET